MADFVAEPDYLSVVLIQITQVEGFRMRQDVEFVVKGRATS